MVIYGIKKMPQMGKKVLEMTIYGTFSSTKQEP
jgi:hypothetical protein